MKIFTTKFKMRGFTLVELMVVMALFITVMTVAIGALFSAQAINTKLQQTQIILDGVNLAMEEIVRDVRYGSIYYCTNAIPQGVPDRQSCPYPTGNTVLVFKPTIGLTVNNSLNDRVAYYLSKGALYKQNFPEGVPSAPVQITASDVTIENLKFYVKGAETSGASTPDFIQPVITISLSGVTHPVQSSHVTPVHFSVQTTASSRKMDN